MLNCCSHSNGSKRNSVVWMCSSIMLVSSSRIWCWVCDSMQSICRTNLIEWKINFLGGSLDGHSCDYRHVFDVNVIAACACIREAVKLMRENGSFGHIIVLNRYAFPRRNLFSNKIVLFMSAISNVCKRVNTKKNDGKNKKTDAIRF